MPANDQTLTAQALALLGMPAGSTRDRAAAALGARAADSGHDVEDVVTALLAAAGQHWAAQPHRESGTVAGQHAAAAKLLDDVTATFGIAVVQFRQQMRDELSEHDSQRTAFVNDLLAGNTNAGHLAERAHRYGIRLSGSHIVLAATAPEISNELSRRVDTLLAARYGAGNTLTTLRDNRLICITAGGLRGLPAELAHHLISHIGADGWQIGVGRPHPGINGIATSLSEALNTLDLAAKLGFTTPVLQAADLLVFPVLLRDRDAITDLVNTVLGPLQHARGGPEPYLDTLTVLFEHQGNHTATARAMHLSVRAVTYRLDRIHALTGYHPSEPTQRFTLHTAVLGARLLGWPNPPG
jgi:sugar diacid utilization regulator